MKTPLYPLLILQSLILLLSTSKFIPKWTKCTADFQQWFPHNVTVTQNPHLKEVLTISACGAVAPSGWFTAFNHLEVNGSIAVDYDYYTWNSSVPYRYLVGPSEFCLNYTTYLPDLNGKEVNVSILAIDNYDYQVGCIDIVLKNHSSILYDSV